jgi:Xaa-Pro aminopeptidase
VPIVQNPGPSFRRLPVVSFVVLLATFTGAAPSAGQAGSPAGPVPVELLAARRAKLLAELDGGIAVLRSGTVRSIEGDYPQDSDYREKNEFFYLTGLEEPDAWLVLDARGRADRQARLYLQPRNPQMEQWTGARLGPGPEAVALSGITDVRSTASAESEIGALVREAAAASRPVFTDLERAGSAACRGYTPRGRSCAPALDAVDADPSLSPESLDRLTAALRLVKDADEIRRLKRAIDITTAADSALAAVIEPGMYEYQLEAVIEFTFRRNGAERVGFPSIVGSGPNSTTLHYDKNRRQMQAGDLVVVDIGAEFGYYSADVTRTFPVSGTFTDRQRAIYDLVLGAQQAAMDAVRPGVTLGELSRLARAYIDAHSGDLCGGASCTRYFIHGLSHSLGMDVHDVGSMAGPLRPGMVFTIEPGLYIADEQLGIRIEDDVLVTETGYERLSAGAPRTAADIERLIAEARSKRMTQNQ